MTQAEQILNHMETKGAITPLEALVEYRCMRLGARIYDLKKLGYDIRSGYVEGTNSLGEVKRYKEYWLHREPA